MVRHFGRSFWRGGVSLLLALTLAATAFAGCAGADSATPAQTTAEETKAGQETKDTDDGGANAADAASEDEFRSVLPEGMEAALPTIQQELLYPYSDYKHSATMETHYAQLVGDTNGTVSLIERTEEEYTEWKKGNMNAGDGVALDIGKYEPGWLAFYVSTYFTDNWGMQFNILARWLVEPEIYDFDELLDFCWSDGRLIPDTIYGAYGYREGDTFKMEELTLLEEPDTTNASWGMTFSGDITQESDVDKTVHLAQTHEKGENRTDEVLFLSGRLRSRLTVLEILYGVRYQLLASDTLHNKWTTVIKSYKPFSTISEVLKGELENAAHYSFFGSVDNGLGSSGIQEASAYETFIFHEYDVFFQREPSIEELDRWTQALVSHTARPKDLVKDCMTSEDFEKSGLTLGEKIVVMCASCGMGEISDEQVQQWIGRFEAGLTMEEAAEELTGTEDFEQFLSIFQFELDK